MSFLFGNLVIAQELPPIIKYPSSIYKAGSQNWMISQDKNHFVYFANNEGLLEFNGANWTLYKSPNQTIMRSVNVINNKVFTGCYMEFGYWDRTNNGKLLYHSISDSIKSNLFDDEQFWNIINYDQWVIFQSLNRIYIYDTKTKKIKIITPKNNILRSFKTLNSIYFQVENEGLFEIENEASKLVTNNEVVKKNKIVSIFNANNELLIQTQSSGFYKFSDEKLSKFVTDADSAIIESNMYSCQLLSDGSYVLGTISNGIFILTSSGKIKYHITQTNGLNNNTALSLFEDVDKNLWIGLDNGICCINLQSPFISFSDNTGVLGTVYSSILYNKKLYIGTNHGLFYKEYLSSEQFKFIEGTKGQVWSLFIHDNTLFCGHDSGTFIIDNTNSSQIFSQTGTWKFEVYPYNSNIIIQGNYNGLSILEKINNKWIFKNKIDGFHYSSKFFEIINKNEIYVSHEYKGIFRFQLNSSLTKTEKLYAYTKPNKGKNAGLIKYNNTLYYAFKDGIFKLNTKNKQFEKDKILSTVFDRDEYSTGKLIIDNTNKLWLFSKNYINYFTINKFNSELKKNTLPIPSSLTNSMLGYENISQLSTSLYLVGTTDGYYTININDLTYKNYKIYFSDISTNKLNEKSTSISFLENGNFSYDNNNVNFSYTIPVYNKYINTEYQYLLKGFQDQWSEWSAIPVTSFKNLPSGDYVFKVKARIANSAPENVATYDFTIKKPWYSTNIALLLYCFLIIYFFVTLNRLYKMYYQKQREKLIDENNLLLEIKELEVEQQLMKIRNEQLTQDVDSKNKEIAVSTMSLIKKDELLSLIKKDLKNSSEETSGRSIKSVILTITKNINEENTWNVFKEAFDNADKDFLKIVKAKHSTLTPNDLRLCAYLRLNLSSKEIAPLLNISVRSIEIKRYRLRKKMNLNHEQGLVEYILSI